MVAGDFGRKIAIQVSLVLRGQNSSSSPFCFGSDAVREYFAGRENSSHTLLLIILAVASPPFVRNYVRR